MKKNYIIAVLVLFNLAGCTSLTEQGSKVSISHTVWQGCRFVASINGADTDSNSDLALRNKAGSIGANLVVVTGYANHGLLYGEVPSKGDAYQCVTQAQKRETEEKLRLEQEKKLAEERARFEAEKKLAEEKAKADEIARIEAEKAKIEEEKRVIAEEKARLEKLKADAEAEALAADKKLAELEAEKNQAAAKAKTSATEKSDRAPSEAKAADEVKKEPNSNVTSEEKDQSKKDAGAEEKKTKLSENLTPVAHTLESQISKESSSSTQVQ